MNPPIQPETDAERAYHLLAESMKMHDTDSSMLADYDYADSSSYSAGYQDGWYAHAAHVSLKFRLYRLIPYSIRSKYYTLRRRLFPHNSDIPF